MPSSEALAFVLSGEFRDPDWCHQMRSLIAHGSPGPFTLPHPDYSGDHAYVSNPSGDMLLDCGSVKDPSSMPDAILFAAARNAVPALLNDASRCDTGSLGVCSSHLEADVRLAFLLAGNFRDPNWRFMMRSTEAHASPGLFLACLEPDFPIKGNSCAYITNMVGNILLDCGPLEDSTSVIDAIVFAAARNAVSELLDEPTKN